MKRKSLHGLRLAIVLLIALPILISSRTPRHTSEAQGGGTQAVGNYLQGTTVNARAHPNGGCWLDHWSGCGTSGNANPISFVVNSSCVITAHIQCVG